MMKPLRLEGDILLYCNDRFSAYGNMTWGQTLDVWIIYCTSNCDQTFCSGASRLCVNRHTVLIVLKTLDGAFRQINWSPNQYILRICFILLFLVLHFRIKLLTCSILVLYLKKYFCLSISHIFFIYIYIYFFMCVIESETESGNGSRKMPTHVHNPPRKHWISHVASTH